MEPQHLSRLCRGDDVQAILAFIRQRTLNQPIAEDDEAGSNYLAGLLGYQDEDGRTAFHWAVALENYDLARTLMHAPHNAPVLSEDHAHVIPFTTACLLAAPDDFLAELLTHSVASYAAYMKWKAAHPTTTTTAGVSPPASQPQGQPSSATPPTSSESNTAATTDNNAAQDMAPQASAPRETNDQEVNDNDAAARLAIVNWQDELGNTPLFASMRKGQWRVAHFLLQHGADLQHQNHRGQSVLHRAVMTGRMNIVEELVFYSEKLHGPEKKRVHARWVNLQDIHGDSALFYASQDNNQELGVFLLRHGADRHLRNKDEKEFWEV